MPRLGAKGGMDWVISVLDWIGRRTGWVKYTGLPWLVRIWLRRLRGSVMGIGATFFASRDALNQRRDFNEFLGTAENIDAIFVTGQKFITHHHASFRRIRRLILPDPESPSFRFYAVSVGDADAMAKSIKQATKICRDSLGIKVRWCPQLIHESLMLGDADRRTGWVHVELVLPFSKANLRPSFTIYKSRFDQLVTSYDDIFKVLWEKSVEPPALTAPVMAMDSALGAAVSPYTILSGKWILNFNIRHERGSKEITFTRDGSIGQGKNENEHRWVFDGAILSIFRIDGSLQNNFRYEDAADRFVCTNDRLARGNKDQTIYRPTVLVSG